MYERRKSSVMHNILQTMTYAVFLLLATLLIYDRWDNDNSTANIDALRKELQDQNLKNVYFLEGRINRVAEVSDSYQNNVTRRLDVLEIRQQVLENKRKDNNRIINTNTNSISGN